MVPKKTQNCRTPKSKVLRASRGKSTLLTKDQQTDKFSTATEDRMKWNTFGVLGIKYHLKILHMCAASYTRRNRPRESGCGTDSPVD